MTEFQHYGILKDGSLAFAGPATHKRACLSTAQGIKRRWIKWATHYVAENPGEHPTAKTARELPINPIVEIRLHPVGQPELCQAFAV